MTVVTATIFAAGLWVENRKRERGERDWRLCLPENERGNLGDDHPSVRFAY
jgi:hypothetical protein